MNENEHVSELLPALALGILDPDEAARAKAHLQVCSQCQAEMEAYTSISENLVLAVPTYEPPRELKGKILRAVSEKSSPPRSFFSWEKYKTTFSALPAAWLVVGILVLALAASNLLLWRELTMLRSSAQEMRFITIAMEATDAAPLATGMIVINPSGLHGTMVVDGLPYLEPANQYQLWLIRNGMRTSGGAFSVNEQGYASIEIYAHDPLISYPGFGITIEPAGGSEAPTGDRVLAGEL